jgi:hypothetical protein
LDTHEHLVEEHWRLRTEGCAIEEMNGEKVVIPADWVALLTNYALDDLVSAGLPQADVQRLLDPELKRSRSGI